MTSEELVAAGVPPTEGNIPSSANDPVAETIGDSSSREDGEIRSENRSGGEEDLSNVDADLSDLVALATSSYPPAFVFGESKVKTDLIKEHEEFGFFPAGDGRPPFGEQVPAPEANEVVVFRDFFICGLRFPCDTVLPSILEKFDVKIHQLTPNSFLELSKFFWIRRPSSALSALTYSLVYLSL
jgi:hypothetical protein